MVKYCNLLNHKKITLFEVDISTIPEKYQKPDIHNTTFMK